MKKISNLLMIAFLAIMSISCSNDDDEQVAPIVVPTATDGFRWTDSSGPTVQTVDNPYVNGSFNSIFAVRSGATIYEINLTSLAVGTYPLGGGGNALYYNSTGALPTSFNPTSGSVVITANANNKLTGTFSATGTGGGVTTVSGSFTNITINP